jgi:hypothetical protein
LAKFDEAVPAEPAEASPADELSIPGLMDLADGDLDDDYAETRSDPDGSSIEPPSGLLWPPPVAIDKLPTIPMAGALDEPLEVDSSIQSGGYRKESPWGATPPVVEGDGPLPETPARKQRYAQPEIPPEAISADDGDEPPLPSPPTINRSKKLGYSDEIDPEFGTFLDGLQ